MLELEKKRTAEEVAKADKYRDENIHLRKINHEIQDLYKQIGSMAGQIRDELLPATQKIVDLKAKLHELYMKLGKDANHATYETLCVTQEWDKLAPCVTEIVRAGTAKSHLKEKEGESAATAEAQVSSEKLNVQPIPNKAATSKKQKTKSK